MQSYLKYSLLSSEVRMFGFCQYATIIGFCIVSREASWFSKSASCHYSNKSCCVLKMTNQNASLTLLCWPSEFFAKRHVSYRPTENSTAFVVRIMWCNVSINRIRRYDRCISRSQFFIHRLLSCSLCIRSDGLSQPEVCVRCELEFGYRTVSRSRTSARWRWFRPLLFTWRQPADARRVRATSSGSCDYGV